MTQEMKIVKQSKMKIVIKDNARGKSVKSIDMYREAYMLTIEKQ